MNTRIDSFRTLGIGILLVSACILPARLVGQTGRPSTPVTVDGPVTVQGVVDVINDVLRTPFVVTATNLSTSDSPTITIDIPDGKRLIIETIAFQASRATTDSNRMFFQPWINGARQLVPLPVQTNSEEGVVTYMISMIPLKARVDAVAGNTGELLFRRGTGSIGTLVVTVMGYLVDL